MRPGQFRTIISSILLLAVCALAACGKTGALYLPDASPEAGNTAPTLPAKTQ